MSDRRDDIKPICGLVMPISRIAEYDAEHWKDVKQILEDAILTAGFSSRLVSDSDESGVIQSRIVQNLYSDDLVVCDVSGKNPNVMFELGMRLAFDKPTVVVKDDITDYSFDTGVIDHVGYPRDLRFNQIVQFKSRLSDVLKKTHQASTSDPNYSTFLKNFGEYKIARLDEREVTSSQLILQRIDELSSQLGSLERRVAAPQRRFAGGAREPTEKQLALIEPYIVEYANRMALDRTFGLENSLDQLVEHLETKPEVRTLFGSRSHLRHAARKAIESPF